MSSPRRRALWPQAREARLQPPASIAGFPPKSVRLDPGAEGSEQADTRPVIIISRDSINIASTVVLAVPCTTYRGRRIYPAQVLLHNPEGGLTADSLALGEQVRPLAKGRLLRRRGLLSAGALA